MSQGGNELQMLAGGGVRFPSPINIRMQDCFVRIVNINVFLSIKCVTLEHRQYFYQSFILEKGFSNLQNHFLKAFDKWWSWSVFYDFPEFVLSGGIETIISSHTIDQTELAAFPA